MLAMTHRGKVATTLYAAALAVAITPTTGGPSAPAGAAPIGGSAGCQKLEHLWEHAGGSPAQAQMAASIAMAESGGNAGSTDNDGNGTVDRGYWQINSVHGAQSTYDPLANAQAAVQISGDGTNWTPWVTYQTGAYQGLC